MSRKEGLPTSRVTATTKVDRWNVACPSPPTRVSGPSRPVRALKTCLLLIMVALLHRLLAGSALVACTAGQITSDTEFYGQSPPVYPSPEGQGLGDWQDAYAKAQALVGQMTLEEKVSLTGGVRANNLCSGNIPAISRLNFPGLCLSDGPAGVRSTNYVSSWPSGISAGASWNRNLTRQRGVEMALEFKRKGVQVPLGPVVGPLGRIATGGRNWEGFANDPYLAGILVADTVEGMQSTGVVASTKHFIMNEQERNRNPEGNVEAVSSNLDDKTMHELYLWPFQDAVKAGTGSIMCSYQRINNSYGCANSKTQNGLLKTELGFQGYVVTDWGAQHSGVATALAGLDMVMPSGSQFWGGKLVQAVTNGSVPESRIDDMVTRILSTWYKFNQDTDFPAPGIGMPPNLAAPHERIIGRSASGKPVLLQGAIESHVLLKNTNNALPLKEPKQLSIFGYSSRGFDRYTPSSPSWNDGGEALGPDDQIRNGGGFNVIHSQIASNGTLLSGGGSGATQPAYLSSTFEALSQRAYEDGTNIWWDFVNPNPQVDPTSDACIVDVNAYAAEGWDRVGVQDDYTDSLILNIASKCANTIVVFQNAGVRLVDGFVDHPNVTALIFAHLPGQDSGRALASILYGDANPSGKLPYSVPHTESDWGPIANETRPEGIYQNFPQSDFDEGVFIDYRAFDKQGIEPRYEFGFGLSYTTFNYTDVKASAGASGNTDPFPTGPIESGGQIDLWDVIAQVSATVTNTGEVAGAEVAQLYVGIPGDSNDTPVRQLRGFAKPTLAPGESATVEFPLNRRDLSTWDVAAQNWKLQKGEYKVYVGSSSRSLPLTTALTL
ncbi:family 3 glycoside hydrolase [Apiospora rasikravindrae]|uniref:beta-glucosidase n=1 Tax=Apiospora rasikravindrae TaxID=990691 RepID=A0ABR1SCQ7_9PEZI